MIKRYKDLIKIAIYLVVVPLIIWNLSIGTSIDIWNEYRDNIAELHDIKKDDTPVEIIKTSVLPKGSLLDFVAKNKEVEIVKYNRYTTTSVDDYSLVANVLVLTGDFFKLLKVVSKIEKSWIVSSLTFHSEFDYKNKQKFLKATIITQDVIKLE